LVWGVDVDEDVLRGSGRPLPNAVAAALGVSTRNSVRLHAPGGEVRVYFSKIQCQIGSLRHLADSLGARIEDRLLIHVPQLANPSFTRIAPGHGIQAAGELVGQRGNVVESHLSQACWQPDVSLLYEALWDREETKILASLEAPLSDPRSRRLDLRKLDDVLQLYRKTRGGLLAEASLPSWTLYPDGGEGIARVTSTERTLIGRALSEVELDEAELWV
jgi:hypothetical protein